MSTLRVSGRCVNADREFDASIEINAETGLIETIGPAGARPAPFLGGTLQKGGASDIDTKNCLIFPGFVDVHVHAREDQSGRENYKEDFVSVSRAATNGGVTHIADMPNNPVAPVDDARYRAKQELAKKALVDITLYAGIGPGTRPLSSLVPYKVFMGPSVGDLFFTSRGALEETIHEYRGASVSFHCEDPEILESHKGEATHEARRPREAEIAAIDFALALIERYGLTGKICHLSTAEGLKKIMDAKTRGVPVTVEITPQHLFFDEGMITEENRRLRELNPPFRAAEDRAALTEALRRGEIDCLASDHAPHTPEEKIKGVSGIPFLDTYGPFTAWLIKEHGFSPQDIARVCAYNPGRFVNAFRKKGDPGKGFGKIEEGYVGSLTILDITTPVKVGKAMLRTKCGWSPCEGMTFPGSVRYAVVRGAVYQKGNML